MLGDHIAEAFAALSLLCAGRGKLPARRNGEILRLMPADVLPGWSVGPVPIARRKPTYGDPPFVAEG